MVELIATALIVDDDASNIDLLRGLLPDTFKVKAAKSGKVALKIVEKAAPDIIFLDVQMPEMSGDETAQALRLLPEGQQLKVVYVSASELPQHVPDEDGFLLKPVDKRAVEQVLMQLL